MRGGENNYLGYNRPLLLGKIATESEAHNIGGSGTVTEGNKCAIKNRAEALGCKVNGTYKSNQLVQVGDLQPGKSYDISQRQLTLYWYSEQALPNNASYLDIPVDYYKKSGELYPMEESLVLVRAAFDKTCPYNSRYVTQSEVSAARPNKVTLILTEDYNFGGSIIEGTINTSLVFHIGSTTKYTGRSTFYSFGISIPECYRSNVSIGSNVGRSNNIEVINDQRVFIDNNNTMVYFPTQFQGNYSNNQDYPNSDSWIRFNDFGVTWKFVFNAEDMIHLLL